MKPQWHGQAGWKLSARDGTYCGLLGSAYPCDSYEDGVEKGLAVLRQIPLDRDLKRTFYLNVTYF